MNFTLLVVVLLTAIAFVGIVIALSNSGESNEILALIPVLKRLQVPLICMTSRPERILPHD